MSRSLKVAIEKAVYGGRGMGRVGGKVVFIPFTLPGEQVEAEVTREKKDYVEAVLKRVEQRSPRRIDPFCHLFQECGGCQYQHLPYPEQLKLKEAILKDTLGPLIRKATLELHPVIPSPHDRGYRIRAQVKAGRRGGRPVLGFYAWKTHRIVDVEECALLHPLVNRILAGLRNWMGRGSPFCIQGADIQVSPDEGKGVVHLRGEGPWRPWTVEEIEDRIPDLKGMVVKGKPETSWGELTLSYDWPELLSKQGLRIRTSGASFFQVNPYQNWNLMRKVVEWAGLTGKEKVLDLFCGSGNLTLPLAQKARQVWGIDQDREAIDYAVENARRNNLSNCRFIAASAEEGMRLALQETRGVEVVVLDPPRAGARTILDRLAALRPSKILYISCEPPTLLRDLTRLVELGYEVEQIQPLDMFPQTYHVEVLAECRLQNTQ
jgi:23S rRNA (uracil1939-C5)-methyltransferase